jgi:hypothetical protein
MRSKQKDYNGPLYTDSNGKKWVLIKNFNALSEAMSEKYGSNWEYEVRYTYGDEQLCI